MSEDNEMAATAKAIAEQIVQEGKADISFVFVYRAKDGLCGASVNAPDHEIDTVLATVIELMGDVRRNVLSKRPVGDA